MIYDIRDYSDFQIIVYKTNWNYTYEIKDKKSII